MAAFFRSGTGAQRTRPSMEDRLMVLIEASAALTRTMEPSAVLTAIIELADKLLPSDAHAIWRQHAASGQWHIASSAGLSEAYRRDTIEVLKQTPQMPSTPIVASDVRDSPLLADRQAKYEHEGIRSLMAVPLKIRDAICGTLVFYYREPHIFDDWEIRIATAVANLAASIIASADSYEEQTHRREESQKREARLRLALDAGRMGVWDWDLETGEFTWSEEMGANSEIDPRRSAQTFATFRDLIHAEDRYAVDRAITQAIECCSTFDMEFRVVTPDKGTRWIACQGQAFGADGKAHRLIGVVMDITARKLAEQDTKFLADASASLAALVDYQSTLQNVAKLAVPNFADWCTVDLLGDDGTLQRLAVEHVDPSKVKLAHELHRRFPSNPNRSSGTWQILKTGKPELLSEISDEFLRSTVKEPELLDIIRELGLRSYIGVPLSVRDKIFGTMTFISAESGRLYNKKDLQLAEDLARRAAIAIENARLYHELQVADRSKEEFLGILAHELRNPLAPISTGLQVLNLQGEEAEVVDMMERQVAHLVRLVDDLLDVSRLIRNKVELRCETLEVATVIRQAVETSRPIIEAEGHQLVLSIPDEPLFVHGDLVRLSQVVSNLLNNAARYSDHGKRIWLTLSRHGDHAKIAVRDEGVGISTDMLPKIWDMFVQADRKAKRSQGGMGIGLTLVRTLVEMHGGSTYATSDGVGQGSEFIVSLPLSATRPKGPVTRNGPELANVQQRRVLIVDDNIDAAKALRYVLEKCGHVVAVANDGPSALKVAEQTDPELVLLDIGMPGMDGYEVARRFRLHPKLRDKRLVALTGWGQQEDRARSKQAGFDAHRVKPIQQADLAELLASL